jgi:hypothetical protein
MFQKLPQNDPIQAPKLNAEEKTLHAGEKFPQDVELF